MARASRRAAASSAPASPATVKKPGFISYAHEDHDQFKALQPYVKAVRRGLPWAEVKADNARRPGQYWEDEILKMIAMAHVLMLLVSPAFLAGDRIWQKELPGMRKHWQAVSGLLLPVALKQCPSRVVRGSVQALPIDGGKLKPIAEWSDPSRGSERPRPSVGVIGGGEPAT
jgi:hypothetical protein